MDHANHAPDTHRHGHHQHRDETPSAIGDFTYVRVKTSDSQSERLDVAVPIDLSAGISTKLRLYRENLAAAPCAEFQIVPSGAPLEPPLAPDRSADDNWIKHVRLGTITVALPGGTTRSFSPAEGQDGDAVDLTKGLEVTYKLRWGQSSPIGPMLDVDVSQQP